MEELDNSYMSVKKKKKGLEEEEGLDGESAPPNFDNEPGNVDRIILDTLQSLGDHSREALPNQPKKKRMTMLVTPEQ